MAQYSLNVQKGGIKPHSFIKSCGFCVLAVYFYLYNITFTIISCVVIVI